MQIWKLGNKSHPIFHLLNIDNEAVPHIFTEISVFKDGEVPKGAVPVTKGSSTSVGYWEEAARYVIYEEVFDKESKHFHNPQYPSIEFRHFEKLRNIFNEGKINPSFVHISLQDMLLQSLKVLNGATLRRFR